MKSSNELHISTNSTNAGLHELDSRSGPGNSKPDWFQQIHEGVDSVVVPEKQATLPNMDSANSAHPSWQEIALLGLAVLLLCYSYYTSN